MNMYANDNITINFNKLSIELAAASFKEKVSYYECTDVFRIITKEVLTLEEELEFKAILDNHTDDFMEGTIKEVVDLAIEYGHKLLVDFSTANVMSGITQAGLTEAVLDYMGVIKMAVDSGSLYVVIAKLDALIFDGVPDNLAPFVTTEKLEGIKADIETYLAG